VAWRRRDGRAVAFFQNMQGDAMPSAWTPTQSLAEKIAEAMADKNSDDQARVEEFKKALSGELGETAWYKACSGLGDALTKFFEELTEGHLGFALAMRCSGRDWGACVTNMPIDVVVSTLKTTAKQVKASIK
jgi:hypothetical protein